MNVCIRGFQNPVPNSGGGCPYPTADRSQDVKPAPNPSEAGQFWIQFAITGNLRRHTKLEAARAVAALGFAFKASLTKTCRFLVICDLTRWQGYIRGERSRQMECAEKWSIKLVSSDTFEALVEGKLSAEDFLTECGITAHRAA
jgi:hypothetical protein